MFTFFPPTDFDFGVESNVPPTFARNESSHFLSTPTSKSSAKFCCTIQEPKDAIVTKIVTPIQGKYLGAQTFKFDNIETIFDETNVPPENWYPRVGSCFRNWSFMSKILHDYASRHNFLFSRKCSYYSNLLSQELFHSKERVMQRGYLYCSHKNSCGVSCNWKLNYTYDKEKHCYIIKSNSDLTHNHNVASHHQTTIHGREFVSKEKQLTFDENAYLTYIGKHCSYGMPSILETMNSKFMGRTYDRNMLWRVINKVKDCEYGPDRHRIPELIEMAKKHEATGGVYKIGHDSETFRLNKFILQTHSMKCYAKLYNDFTSIDYTHGGNKYKLLTCIPTGVDCLGKSVFFGVAVNISENFQDVSEVINVLGLDSAPYSEGTLMHDNGSAFEGLQKKFKMRNILCTKHVSMNAEKASGGLGELREEFQHCVHTVLYYPYFDSDQHLLNEIAILREKCMNKGHMKSVNFLDGLKRNRKKVAAFHTQKIFTAQQKANTRCEGTNSRFKGNGTLKKELMNADLVRSINRIIHISEQQDQESMIEITKLIEKNMQWSSYVDEALNDSLRKANNIFNVKRTDMLVNGQEKWIVTKDVPLQHGGFQSKTTVVVIPGEKCSLRSPICLNCDFYQSSWLPCPCIAAVFGRKKENFKSLQTLHPFWHLDKHPLWCAAHEKLGLTYTTTNSPDLVINADNNASYTKKHLGTKVDCKLFSSIKYPTEEPIRVARLREKFNEVADIAKQSKNQYQHFYAMLLKEQNHLMSFDVGTIMSRNDRCIVIPPKDNIKKRKLKENDTKNYSQMKRQHKFQKVPKKCSVCKQMNHYQADSDKHRAGSSKCPFYNKNT